MGHEPEYRQLFEVSLAINEAELERSQEAIIGDENIRVLMRENRIALSKGRTVSVTPQQDADPLLAYYDVPLTCVIHSHPECRFHWARLVVDVSPTPGARVHDMVPLEIRGDKPVELKTTIGAGMKFEVASRVLSIEPKIDFTSSRSIYFPEIVSSGPTFDLAIWDFLAPPGTKLHANRELRLLLASPLHSALLASFKLAAEVTLEGFAGKIPLLARGKQLSEVYRLD
jgi:hypothetical protein